MDYKTIISILIAIVIAITIVTSILTQNESIQKEKETMLDETDEISSMLQKIEEDKIKNDNSDSPFVPKEREWIRSGPFSIDRSEYLLGEKIFANLDYLPENIKGEMRFVKHFNSTHNQQYKTIGFDGSKPQNNFYLGIYPSISRGFCTSDSLVGEWELIFSGTPYDSLDFKIVNQIIPGMENQFESVC